MRRRHLYRQHGLDAVTRADPMDSAVHPSVTNRLPASWE
jgi:hypothetical protein